MNRFVWIAVAALTAGTAAFAQGTGRAGPCGGTAACAGCPGPGDGQGCTGRAGGQARGGRFDPATVTTTSGTVESVTTGVRGRGQAVLVQLKTSKAELVEVHLGPAWFLQEQKLGLEKGDPLEVTGSTVTGRRGEFVVAQHVRKGEQTITLRDANGVPQWAGARRR